MDNIPKLESTELDKFLEKYELDRIRSSFKERVLTIIIASLGLISALAWDDALKHIFENLFGSSGTLTEEIIYAVVITLVAAAISVYLGKLYKKDIEKNIENK